ncbi:MAG: ABC transporter permease subunit [Candidatus Cloacimonetes bacterium]|jgi:ABC-2 type transport system permease protein|nr:ABC transporter permease subunit [Candidatus Cloacimonadota bacterium]MBT4331893.1 ABC transporter permease subunit [Candidatus Cloacimonadota bacterium]MBT4575373.1 ABC transporter permease subunit [Candidatus Cloacimonadota bacterium]MBT5419440.1 ABC transporter permease subunit [Candidatus Cloacimonadota bacterium]
MNLALTITKKEMKSYFNSPAAYIVLVIFLLLSGWFFASPLFINNQANLRTLFSIIPLLYLFFIPAITMGLLSREKNTGTMELLATLPLKDTQIVMGKFWASVSLIGVGLLLTSVHFFTIILLGTNVDIGAIFCGYIGLLFLGAVYSSIGIFASSITSNQIVSLIISFFIIFFFFVIKFFLFFVPDFLVGTFQFLSIDYHFSNIIRGVIDTRNIIYFVSLIVLFLKLAQSSLENRNWK